MRVGDNDLLGRVGDNDLLGRVGDNDLLGRQGSGPCLFALALVASSRLTLPQGNRMQIFLLSLGAPVE